MPHLQHQQYNLQTNCRKNANLSIAGNVRVRETDGGGYEAEAELDDNLDAELNDDLDAELDDDLDAELDDDFDVDDFDAEDQAILFGGNIHPPEYYQQAVKDYNDDEDDGQDYSERSQLLLDACEGHWRAYCKVLKMDHIECFRSITHTKSLRLLYNFFDWRLNQKVGKNGRKLCGTRKSSSLGTYWKTFRLVFERTMTEKLDAKVNRQMHKILRKLAIKHGLSDQKRVNRLMSIDDLKGEISTIISTTTKSFRLGELRILTVLYFLLLAPTGSRPAAILHLRFGDMSLALARDPDGGPPNVLIRFTPTFTKSYLGTKDNKTHHLPCTYYDDSLLLNPHIFLLGILFRHKAFQPETLVSPDQLWMLHIHPDERELPLPLKNDLKDVYVFRRAIKTVTGYEISQNTPIPNGTMAQWIRRIGEILGLQYSNIAYSLRYNAANGLDDSVNVSDSLRNIILDHKDSTAFRRHYLGRQIRADTWAILRQRKQQQALINQACSVGHSISKRRPIGLTSAQSKSVNEDPVIRRLMEDMKTLRRGSPEHIKKARKLRNEKQRLKRLLKETIREQWTANQAVDDIERQLRGDGFDGSHEVGRCEDPTRPAQKQLMEALNVLPQETLEQEHLRMSSAINAVVTYCSVIEAPAIRLQTKSTIDSPALDPESQPSYQSLQQRALIDVFPRASIRSRRCFLCVGKAQTLNTNDPIIETLCREFYSPTDLNKHFRRSHVRFMSEKGSIRCPACSSNIHGEQALLCHAQKVHGIFMRPVT